MSLFDNGFRSIENEKHAEVVELCIIACKEGLRRVTEREEGMSSCKMDESVRKHALSIHS